jgi:2-dehydro-3-deoxygluconokinase
VKDLRVKPAGSCRWDLVSLGEVMLRLDPGDVRISSARHFDVWEGGGEYNVARGLKRCFGLRTAIVTALADNPVGRLVEDLMYQGGVEQAHLAWLPYDGVGRDVRNGLNFTERGFGVRAALGCSDRGHTAASRMAPGDIDWDDIFGRAGARWFHCGGVFCALSASSAQLAHEAMEAARRHGVVVSFDLNFRPSLWAAFGGGEAASELNRELVKCVDVLVGNEEDFSAALGYDLEVDEQMLELRPEAYERLFDQVAADYPQLAVIAATLRQAHTATVNDWSAVCMTASGFHQGLAFTGLEILDRVGGGDSFASGFFYGLMSGLDEEQALGYGIAHGALAMTTPGDTSMASLREVQRVAGGASARVVR